MGSRLYTLQLIHRLQSSLLRTFDPVSTDREKARELIGLKQGNDSVCDYAICFHTMAVESGRNTALLYDVFLKGLTASIQELLVPLDVPADLDFLIAFTIWMDNQLHEL